MVQQQQQALRSWGEAGLAIKSLKQSDVRMQRNWALRLSLRSKKEMDEGKGHEEKQDILSYGIFAGWVRLIYLEGGLVVQTWAKLL